MKRIYIMAVLFLLTATPAMAAVSVVKSKHDMVFSGFAQADVTGTSTEVCIFCHTPHGAQPGVTQAPLWNNLLEASDDTAYTAYTSLTTNFPSSVALINATDARLCLACHDGSVGMPVNQPNDGDMIDGGTAMGANTILGTDLSNDHPIGMDLGATSEINPDDSKYSGIRAIATIRTNFGSVDPFFGGALNDNTNIMWCSSCHDVHDSDPLKAPFLRLDNAGSALCKACHIK